MKEATFTNYIEIDGQELRMDMVPEEERLRIAILSADRLMEAAGFRRKNA